MARSCCSTVHTRSTTKRNRFASTSVTHDASERLAYSSRSAAADSHGTLEPCQQTSTTFDISLRAVYRLIIGQYHGESAQECRLRLDFACRTTIETTRPQQ